MSHKCASCSKQAKSWCSQCKRATYCGKECQSKHYQNHVNLCVPFYFIAGQTKRDRTKKEEKDAESEYTKLYVQYIRQKEHYEQNIREIKQKMTERDIQTHKYINNPPLLVYNYMTNADQVLSEENKVIYEMISNPSEVVKLFMELEKLERETMDKYRYHLEDLFGKMSEEARERNKDRQPCHNESDIISLETITSLPEDAKIYLMENNLKYCFDLDALLSWLRASEKNPATNRPFSAVQINIIREAREHRLVTVIWPRWYDIHTIDRLHEMQETEELMSRAYGIEEHTLDSARSARLETELMAIQTVQHLVDRFQFLKQALHLQMKQILWERFKGQTVMSLIPIFQSIVDVSEAYTVGSFLALIKPEPKFSHTIASKFLPNYSQQPNTAYDEILVEVSDKKDEQNHENNYPWLLVNLSSGNTEIVSQELPEENDVSLQELYERKFKYEVDFFRLYDGERRRDTGVVKWVHSKIWFQDDDNHTDYGIGYNMPWEHVDLEDNPRISDGSYDEGYYLMVELDYIPPTVVVYIDDVKSVNIDPHLFWKTGHEFYDEYKNEWVDFGDKYSKMEIEYHINKSNIIEGGTSQLRFLIESFPDITRPPYLSIYNELKPWVQTFDEPKYVLECIVHISFIKKIKEGHV